MNERRGEGDSNLRTFENDSLIWPPDVAKSACVRNGIEKYPTRFVGENTDPRRLMLMIVNWVPKFVNWVDCEVVHVCSARCGKIRNVVKMRVLLESKTTSVLETSKVPKNFVLV
jgi:hypothetical protein